MPRAPSSLLFALLVAGILLPATAEAAPWRNFVGTRVDAVRIEGVGSALAGPLARGLALTPRSQLFRKKRAVLREDLVEADRARVRLYLARRGFPAAEVEVRAEPTSERERCRLIFVVTTGSRVSFGETRIEGGGSEQRAALRAEATAVAEGAPFSDSAVEKARRALQSALQREGHARAEVTARVRRTETGRADLTFVLRPGPRFVFGDVEVDGVAPDLESLARHEITVRRGDLVRPEELRRVRDDLRDLGLFRQTDVRTAPMDSVTLRLVTTLSARQMRTLEFSVGTWSDHPVQVEALWRHRNLLGGGRGLLTQGSYALHRSMARVALQWPSLIRRRSTTEWRAESEWENEDAYDLRELSFQWSNLFRLTRSTSLRAGVRFLDTDLQVRAEDLEFFDVEPGRQIVVFGQWFLDGVDDPLDPTRGWRFLVESNWAPILDFTTAPYASWRVGAGRVHPLAGGITAAARVDLGVAKPLGDSGDLLPSQRFFAGGFNTMRGASRRGLGPANDDREPVGGEARLLTGAELRIPLKGIFGMSAFVDAGQVWADRREARLDSLAVAVGGGLLVRTPVGPIHLEYARNVGVLPIEGNHWQIQFGIGHPY